MRRIFLQSTQKAWVKLVKNTQVHYTELYYRLQNEGSGDWWDLREKFLGISGYSSRMPALWFLAYFSYVNSFSMEMHTLESLGMLWLVWWTWTYFSFKKSVKVTSNIDLVISRSKTVRKTIYNVGRHSSHLKLGLLRAYCVLL